MPFNWRELLDLAEKLQGANDAFGTREALLRSAISRAYYAGFHYACSESGFERTGHGGDHSGVRRHLREKNRRPAAQQLTDLYDWRELADYAQEIDSKRLEQLAADALTTAQNLFQQRF